MSHTMNVGGKSDGRKAEGGDHHRLLEVTFCGGIGETNGILFCQHQIDDGKSQRTPARSFTTRRRSTV